MSRLLAALRPDLPTLFRFGVVGVGCAGLYAALAWTLTMRGGMPAATASVMAYAVAGVISYLGQKRFTFQSAAAHAEAAPRFAAVFLIGIVIATTAPLVMTDRLRLPALVAIVFTCGVVPLINYLVMSRLVFRRIVASPAP